MTGDALRLLREKLLGLNQAELGALTPLPSARASSSTSAGAAKVSFLRNGPKKTVFL